MELIEERLNDLIRKHNALEAIVSENQKQIEYLYHGYAEHELIPKIDRMRAKIEALEKQRDDLLKRNMDLVADNKHLATRIRPDRENAEILDLQAQLAVTNKANSFYFEEITKLYNSLYQVKE